ncbi:MAG TPA: hypothetical protein VLT91_02870 [Rhizomicrobium sp.]|nr:hypothetical protein [Rhizomicrobium sp.]
MANTLGLDDDLDSVELVQDIEKAFDIQITDAEAERTLVVGDLYDLLLSKIPTNDTNKKCASAMIFYRLRRAIRNLGIESELKPATDMHFLETGGTRSCFKKIEAETGLQLPTPQLMWIGNTGCLMLLISVCAVIGLSFALHGFTLFSAPTAACVATFVVGCVFIRTDIGRL